ncbi:hypothetical protein EXIGLDRAFT_750272 [Exidia glandulosa HHB12029]|uniref:Uncharacterized protein n=1 Tax=Exidia glandulosa HHB12029 TaxID=1314781 RepID=A0A165GYS9_EXIGL|nr:hypothetical protein EXIGLDRAFT_750272 [Exidia glandulosa HHB12029]
MVYSRVSVLPHDILLWQCDNDEGYTAFDLTPNCTLRYCFFFYDMKPLSPAEYMRCYYENYEGLDGVEANIRYLSKFASISQEVLFATWPGGFNSPNAPTGSPTTDPVPEPSSEFQSGDLPSLATLSLKAALSDLLDSDDTTADVLDPILAIVKRNADFVKDELLQRTRLNGNGLAVLKAFLASSSDVDLSPWLRVGLLTLDQLASLSDALVNATTLDVSHSPTLAVELLQSLIKKMPKLQHVLALDCPALEKPSAPLTLSSYLETKALKASIEFIMVDQGSHYYEDCVRYIDPASPPAGLTVLIYTRPFSHYPRPTDKEIQHGVELSTFTATGVAHGFALLLRLLFFDDPTVTTRLWFSGFEFPLRAAFQRLDNNGALGALPPLVGKPRLMPKWGSLAVASAESPRTRTSPAPRYPGWTLVLDTKGGVPIIPGWKEIRPSLLDVIREKKGDGMLYRPLYGFVRWDYDEDGTTLVPRQVCDLREWAAQLPRGRGRLDEESALEWDRVLAEQKATLISLDDAANSGKWPDELWEPLYNFTAFW